MRACLYHRTRYGSIGFILPQDADKKRIAFETLDDLDIRKVQGPRCWLYARVDSNDRSNFALNGQIAYLCALARKQGWSIEGKTQEAAVGNTLDRPGLHQVLAAAKGGEMDTLLVHNPLRLYRGSDLYVCLDFIHQLKILGVQTVSAADWCTS